jgi:hypothetical protein
MLIVRNYWQLFSHIFGETLLIVTHIWQNQTCFPHFYSFVFCSTKAIKRENVGTTRKWTMLFF